MCSGLPASRDAEQAPFWVINGGAEGPGRRLQREGPAEAVPTCEAARPRRDAGHGLRGAEGRRGPAGAGAPAARAGQVGRRGAERPAAGRPHRLQPEHAGEDEVRPGGDGRLHPGGRRGTSAEQERRDGGPRHQARRKGADGGRRELRGHDGPGQRVRHAGPGAARKCRAPHEAARGPQRHCRGGPGHPDAEEGPGHEGGAQGRAVERPLSADRFGLQRTAPRDGARRARGRGEAAGHGVQGPPGQRRQVPAQQGPHRPAREGRAGRGRLPSADERGEELQPPVRRRAAAGGRGLHDRPQHGGPGDPAEAGAAGAGQRQRGGPADETQAGGCEAVGRLPGASEAQDPRLI